MCGDVAACVKRVRRREEGKRQKDTRGEDDT